jgi:hypothetical protein
MTGEVAHRNRRNRPRGSRPLREMTFSNGKDMAGEVAHRGSRGRLIHRRRRPRVASRTARDPIRHVVRGTRRTGHIRKCELVHSSRKWRRLRQNTFHGGVTVRCGLGGRGRACSGVGHREQVANGDNKGIAHPVVIGRPQLIPGARQLPEHIWRAR